MINIKNYINGKFVESKNKLKSLNPSTGEHIANIPNSTSSDLENAIDSGYSAFSDWSEMGTAKRSSYLLKLSNDIEKNIDKYAESETIDNGKPISISKDIEIPRAIENLRFFSSIIRGHNTEAYRMEGIGHNYTIRHPLGVVACISPWNLPLYLLTWKIAPALASGNCVIAKPSEITPLTAFLLSESCKNVGFPPGVLNIVHGEGSKIGKMIVKNKKIKAISFTGGTETGRYISKNTQSFKKLSLEMGGKNPVIIFADCDYDKMLNTTIKSSFYNQGQICLAGSRIYVQDEIYDRFKQDFVNRVKKLKVGDPLLDDSDQGPVVSREHLNKIISYIDIAKSEGGNILVGGKRIKFNSKLKNGNFFEPTVIESLALDSVVHREEIFGPVVTINSFKEDEDAMRMANDSDYGLASILWTSDLGKAHKISEKLNSGIVWINSWLLRDLRTPFGGVKQSGFGREGGYDAINFFTEQKNICIDYN